MVAPVCSARWPAQQRESSHLCPSQTLLTLPSGVAVGSSIGHAIGGFFGGGSSAPTETQSALPEDTYNSSGAQNYQQNAGPCAVDVNNFRQCMDQNQGSLTICGWYLDQLKACQSAASQY